MKSYTKQFQEGMHIRINEGRAFSGREAEVINVLPTHVDIKLLDNGLTLRMLPNDLTPIKQPAGAKIAA